MVSIKKLIKDIESGLYEANVAGQYPHSTPYIDIAGWRLAEISEDGCSSSLGRRGIDPEELQYSKIKILDDGTVEITPRSGNIMVLRGIDRENYWGN